MSWWVAMALPKRSGCAQHPEERSRWRTRTVTPPPAASRASTYTAPCCTQLPCAEVVSASAPTKRSGVPASSVPGGTGDGGGGDGGGGDEGVARAVSPCGTACSSLEKASADPNR
jgi:hypothetical protein